MTLRVLLVFAVGCATTQGAAPQQMAYPGGGQRWSYAVRDGIPNGVGRVWHPNGQLRSEGPYLDGDKHGRFRFFTDTGAFEHQALYVHHVAVWSSDESDAEPPAELLAKVRAGIATDVADHTPRAGDGSPSFATLDQVAAPSHVEFELGTSAIRSYAVFASYAFARYGVYAQLLQTNLADQPLPGMSESGKRTVDMGATRRFAVDRVGTVTVRAGLMLPMGNDTHEGFLASAAGAAVDPSNAVASIPSSFAVRSSASASRALARYVAVQADAGIDWVLDGQVRALDAVLRGNVGVGVGTEAALFAVELTNAMLASATSETVTAIAGTATLQISKVRVTVKAIDSASGQTAIVFGLGYAL